MTKTDNNELVLDTTKIANTGVTVSGKTDDAIEPTDNFKLSMTEYTVKETENGKDTNVDYIMIVVTCKAQVKAAS